MSYPFKLISIMLLLILSFSCSKSAGKIVQQFNNEGNKYYAEEKYTEAIASWSKIQNIQPQFPGLQRKIGDAWFKLAAFHKSMRAFKKCLDINPDNFYCHLQIAKIQLILGDINAAKASWEEMKPWHDKIESRIFFADLLEAQGKYFEAEEQLKDVLAINKHNKIALARLAICLLGQEKRREAGDIYEILETEKPQTSAILIQMGNYLILENKRHNGETYFQKAAKNKDNDIPLQIKLAEFYINKGEKSEAEIILKRILSLFPQNRYVKKMLIETLLLDNRLSETWELLETLSDMERKDIGFSLLRGQYFLLSGEPHNAVSQFQTILEEEPDLPIVYYLLGVAYLAGGQTKLGQKSLTRSLILDPDYTPAELLLADIYYKNENYTIALQYAERIKIREPQNYRAHLILANINLALGNYDLALAGYKTVELIYPQFSSSQYYIALTKLLAGNQQEAVAIFQQIVKLNPDLEDAVCQYAKIMVKEGLAQKVLPLIWEASNKRPKNAFLYYILGELYLAENNNKKAVSCFVKALEVDPFMKSTYLKLFDFYVRQPEKLDFLLMSAISKIPNFTEAQVRIATLYCKNHHYKKAIQLLKTALVAVPKSAQIANNLAWLYLEYQPENIDEAMRLSQLAYSCLPNNAAIVDTLGWIYYKKGFFTRAVWLLQEANKLDPVNPTIKSHLAIIRKFLASKKMDEKG